MLLYYIVIGAVFSSVFLLIIASGIPVRVKENYKKSTVDRLSYYTTIPERKEKETLSFFERVILPILRKIAYVVKRISPRGIVESSRHKLEIAGILESVGVDVYLAIKLLFPSGFIFVFILVSVFFNPPLLVNVMLVALIPLSYLFPDLYIRSRISSRQDKIKKALPNALDLLTISVEAGMGFDIALSRVASNIGGPLGEEFNRMLKEMQVGLSRREALRNLSRRTEVMDLDSFVTSIIQADMLGISIGKILRVQASEMRARRRQRAEEEGQKTPVKLVFPLIFCLFPSLLIVIMGPALIRVYGILFGG